jgi:hypothetical protein
LYFLFIGPERVDFAFFISACGKEYASADFGEQGKQEFY